MISLFIFIGFLMRGAAGLSLHVLPTRAGGAMLDWRQAKHDYRAGEFQLQLQASRGSHIR